MTATSSDTDKILWGMVEELKPCVSRKVITPYLNHVECEILRKIHGPSKCGVDWSVCIACEYRAVVNARHSTDFVEGSVESPGKTP